MKEYDGAIVLVTGGAGFIGSHLVDKLMENNAEVRVFDDLSNGSPSNVEKWASNKRFQMIVSDLRDKDAIDSALEDVQYVFHQAAKVSVPLSVKDPLLVLDVNMMGTSVLLEACRKRDVEKVIVASSSSVYGDTPTLPKREDMPTKPISPYGVSKLGGEQIAIAYHHTYGLNTTALRYFNVYGPRQRGGSYAGVISIFISKALGNEPITIEGDGQQSRDFTFVEDVIAANVQAAISSATRGEVYNVGGGDRITIENLANKIIEITNSTSRKVFAGPRAGDVMHSHAAIEKARNDFQYIPKYEISKGLHKTIEWVKSNSEI